MMKIGDVFEKIDGTSVAGMSLDEVQDKLRGAPNSTVRIKYGLSCACVCVCVCVCVNGHVR
jgi:C-terminal processing protease CtpA/Prc